MRFLSALLILLCSCGDDSAVEGTCTLDSDCAEGRCVDLRCVQSDASVQSDTSVSADAAADVGADAPVDVPLDAPIELPTWILTVTNRVDNTVHQLLRVSIEEADFGATTVVCDNLTQPDSLPAGNAIISLTFNHNILYASGTDQSSGDTLMILDPCECSLTPVGRYGYTGVAGITSSGTQEMFGLSGPEDVIFTIDPETALGTLLRTLGESWGTIGLTWSGPESDSLWAITGATDELVQFSFDGSELNSVAMDFDFRSVGMEYHPGVDTIFACSNSGELLTVDPDTGHVTVGPVISAGGLDGICNNLAAPFGSIACII